MTLGLILVLISYLMGSICSAVIVCKLFSLPDPTQAGSKNPGATNVLRLAGKKYAALVLLVDMLKGTIPVLLAVNLHASPLIVSLTVFAAVFGHMYPLFFNFQGGKGVATAIGALLGFHFILGVMVIATWLLVVNFFRYSSLASIIAITLSPLYALLLTHNVAIFPPLCFMVIFILFKHKDNFNRLLDGTESKVFIKENVIKEIMDDEALTSVSQPQAEEKAPIKRTQSITKKTVKKARPSAKSHTETVKKKQVTAKEQGANSSAKKSPPKAKKLIKNTPSNQNE